MLNIIITSVDRKGYLYKQFCTCSRFCRINGFNVLDYGHKYLDTDGYWVYTYLSNFFKLNS